MTWRYIRSILIVDTGVITFSSRRLTDNRMAPNAAAAAPVQSPTRRGRNWTGCTPLIRIIFLTFHCPCLSLTRQGVPPTPYTGKITQISVQCIHLTKHVVVFVVVVVASSWGRSLGSLWCCTKQVEGHQSMVTSLSRGGGTPCPCGPYQTYLLINNFIYVFISFYKYFNILLYKRSFWCWWYRAGGWALSYPGLYLFDRFHYPDLELVIRMTY